MIYPDKKWCNVAYQNKGIIAGGCLRDLITGRLPPKDVDIFIPGLDERHPEYMEGFSVEDREIDGVLYQFIRHRFGPGCEFLEHFDLGICKVAFTPREMGWVFTPEFVDDVGKRQITVLRDQSFNHTKHLASVVARYPDYKLINAVEDLFGDVF